MAEATTDSSGIWSEPGLNPYDCRLTVCYKGKCKTVYIVDGYHDMKKTAQTHLKKTMLELETNPPNPKIQTLLERRSHERDRFK